jgi:hypothetical protein
MRGQTHASTGKSMTRAADAAAAATHLDDLAVALQSIPVVTLLETDACLS